MIDPKRHRSPWLRSVGLVTAAGLSFGCGAEPAPTESSSATAAPSSLSNREFATESTAPAKGGKETVEYLSPTVHIRKRYRSMEGPVHTRRVELAKADPPELLWITGYRASIVDSQGRAESDEYLCHNNVNYNSKKHAINFSWEKKPIDRMFTLSQGQFEIELPEGFGIPILSTEEIAVTTQALNLNHDDPDIKVRQQVEIDFVRDGDLDAPLKPLFMISAYVLALVDGEHGVYGVEEPEMVHDGSSCLPGVAPDGYEGNPIYGDDQGQTFTGHWVVPPGREVRHTRVTSMLDLRADTTIHFIGIHVHPFAESLSLRDLTTDETLWTSNALNRDDGIGLAHVDFYSSSEGIPVYKDHEYEMVSVYDNPTDQPGDAMATMSLYVLDNETEKSIGRVRQKLSWAREAYSPKRTVTQ